MKTEKLRKYIVDVDQINEEPSECSLKHPGFLLELVARKRDHFFAELQLFARLYCRDYFSAVKIVRETMKIEKAKYLFCRMRQARRSLMQAAVSKLMLHKACSLGCGQAPRLVPAAAQANGKTSKVLTDQQQRQKFIQKIANTILQSRRELKRK